MITSSKVCARGKGKLQVVIFQQVADLTENDICHFGRCLEQEISVFVQPRADNFSPEPVSAGGL
jgi:hypothetical protein